MDDYEDLHDVPLSADALRYIAATRRASLEERQSMIRFASVLCRCPAWYDFRDPQAPQERCVVHTTILFDMKGDWL